MKSQKMYIIVFGVIIIKLQISVSEPQFPPHIDLQKVGEAIFNNEKFNILKPTTHRVTDHFKEFMLRTESSYHPAKRVFIDNNGFRHVWSGFGEKTKSLRKTDLKHVSGSFENALEDTPESDIISKDDNDNAIATVEDNNVTNTEKKNENNNQEVENNILDNNDTVQNLNEEDSDTSESEKSTTILNLFPSTKFSIVKRLRQSKDNAEAKPGKKADPAKKVEKKEKANKKNRATTKTNDTKKNGKNKKKDKKTDSGDKAKTDDKKKGGKADQKPPKAKKEKTIITTTFFCPYFGTITMSSFID